MVKIKTNDGRRYSTGRGAGAGYASVLCYLLDQSIAPLAAGALLAGILALAQGLSALGDYIFAAGLLLHFTVWFEAWWKMARAR